MIIDTNILIRFLTNDSPELSEKAVQILENNECIITTLVLAEVVYVLTSVYKYEKDDLLPLFEVMNMDNLVVEDKALNILALTRFCTTNLNFTDAWILARAEIEDTKVATFDKDLAKALKSKKLLGN
jgi:predicted nucleic-acid-binding protein